MGLVHAPLTASGGGTQTWTVTSGFLPTGLSIRTDSAFFPSWFPPGTQAEITGVPATPGAFSFTLQVSDSAGVTSQSSTVKITDLNLKDGYSIPDAFVGSFYSYQLTAFNTTGPVAATFAGCGAPSPTGLPPGMSLSSTGLISGTPTAAGNFNISFTIGYAGDTVCRGVMGSRSRLDAASRIEHYSGSADACELQSRTGLIGRHTYNGRPIYF
jgi:hypothetical protein